MNNYNDIQQENEQSKKKENILIPLDQLDQHYDI